MNLTVILPVPEVTPALQHTLKAWSQFASQQCPHLSSLELIMVADGLLARDSQRLRQWQQSQLESHPSVDIHLLQHDHYQGEGFCYQSAMQFVHTEAEYNPTQWVACLPVGGITSDGPYNQSFDWIPALAASLKNQSIEVCVLDAYPIQRPASPHKSTPTPEPFLQSLLSKGVIGIQNWVKEQCGIGFTLPALPDILMIHRRMIDTLSREFGAQFLSRTGDISTLELYSKLNWTTARIIAQPWPLPGSVPHQREMTYRKLERLWKNHQAFWSLAQWLQHRIVSMTNVTTPKKMLWSEDTRGKAIAPPQQAADTTPQNETHPISH